MAPFLSKVLAASTLAAVNIHCAKLFPRQSAVTVDTSKTYQTIDGFGFSEAFGHASQMQALSTSLRQSVLDVLFNTTTGAGFTIVRNRIGSSSGDTIEPNNPGGPSATPNYVWDGSDTGQVWLSQQALGYDPNMKIFADAWAAPGFMKTTGNEAGGGYLCGVSGASCSSGDWKQAYANYLVKYIQLYAQEGVNVTHVGFLNEPSYTPTYSAMNSNGQQATDFLKVLAPSIEKAGLSTAVTCCDDFGWSQQASLLSGIQSSGGEQYLDVVTAHTYASEPNSALNTDKPIWITECGDLSGTWTTVWDSSGGAGEGYVWADKILRSITDYDVSAYLYWIGAEAAGVNSFLVNWRNNVLEPSGRLWAFAHFGRYAKVGASRVAVSGMPSGVRAGAFANPDGTVSVIFLNSNRAQSSVTVQVSGMTASSAKGHLTDNSHTLGDMDVSLSGGAISANLPSRSLVTIVVS